MGADSKQDKNDNEDRAGPVSRTTRHSTRSSASSSSPIPSKAAATFVPLSPMLSDSSGESYTTLGRHQKRSRTAEERELSRAEQQRKASKKYREKKKYVMEQLEAELDKTLNEKETLEKDNEQLTDLVSEMRQENATLRKSRVDHDEKLERQRAQLLDTLDSMLGRNCSDADLLPVLFQLKELQQQAASASGLSVTMLLNPSSLTQLVRNGFFDPMESSVAVPQAAHLRDFSKKLVNAIPSVTDQQKNQIDELVSKFEREAETMQKERELLDQELNESFFPPPQPQQMLTQAFLFDQALKNKQPAPMNDVPRVMKTMLTLETMRKSLDEEIDKATEAATEILWSLAPKQQAQFYLQLESQRKNILQVKSMWDAMRSSMK